jgi:hypothetical protein
VTAVDRPAFSLYIGVLRRFVKVRDPSTVVLRETMKGTGRVPRQTKVNRI